MFFFLLPLHSPNTTTTTYSTSHGFYYEGMPQRIPSPRELQYHTQSIMQNALIRKKLEEQRENFRKRQEQEMKQQQEQQKGHQGDDNKQDNADNVVITSPTNVANNDMGFDLMKLALESPTKQPMQHQISPAQQHQIQQQSSRQHTSSPSIFTPTSVLRKMTAEKDNDLNGKMGGKGLDDKKKLQQNRMPNQVQPMLGAGGQLMTENEKRILQQQQHFHQMLSQHQQPLPQQMQSMKQQQQQSMKQQGKLTGSQSILNSYFRHSQVVQLLKEQLLVVHSNNKVVQ